MLFCLMCLPFQFSHPASWRIPADSPRSGCSCGDRRYSRITALCFTHLNHSAKTNNLILFPTWIRKRNNKSRPERFLCFYTYWEILNGRNPSVLHCSCYEPDLVSERLASSKMAGVRRKHGRDSAMNVFEAQSDLHSDEQSVVQQNHCLTGKAEHS